MVQRKKMIVFFKLDISIKTESENLQMVEVFNNLDWQYNHRTVGKKYDTLKFFMFVLKMLEILATGY